MASSRIRPGDAAFEIQRLKPVAAGSIPVCYQCRTFKHDFFIQGLGPTQQFVWYHHGCLRVPQTPAQGDARHSDAEMLDRSHRPAEIVDKGAPVTAEDNGSTVQAYDNTPPVVENGELGPQTLPVDIAPGSASMMAPKMRQSPSAQVKPTLQGQYTPPIHNDDLSQTFYDERERPKTPPVLASSMYPPGCVPLPTEMYLESLLPPVTLPPMTHFGDTITREMAYPGGLIDKAIPLYMDAIDALNVEDNTWFWEWWGWHYPHHGA